ncbi:ABC transporter substrate-binding protein [Mesorhizobium sp. B1-1-5]|uniref:ABC transporter substrate-binding protein n=1 Tax=Mesorhizobium sp. B1-1-5 TaxID=2589979 RepID=UPI00112A8259|nr:ABC transporter substrate-binding protein [Mesorhizobium sp. B1-1-5]TPO13739.1 hypothetical protein FJ980_00760 [Mesorhizobium sp. B1-1-5]
MIAAGGLAMPSIGRATSAAKCDQPDKGHIVIAKQIGDIQSFDPHIAFSSSAFELIGNLYDTLITLEGGKLAPGLATWENDGSVWRFTVADGRRFASGNEISAVDVVFSLRRALWINSGPALPLAHLGLTATNAPSCIEVDKTLPNVLVLTLPSFVEEQIVLHCLTSASSSILDSALVRRHYSPELSPPYPPGSHDDGEAWLRFNSAGSGPFQITNAVRTDEIVLQRNAYHPDNSKAIMGLPLIVRNVPDPREQQRLLQCGQVEVAWNAPSAPSKMCTSPSVAVSSKSNGDTVHALRERKANLLILCMNTAEPPLDVTEVRTGIRKAINTNALACWLNSVRWDACDRFWPSVVGNSLVDEFTRAWNVGEAKTALANHAGDLQLDFVVSAGRSAVAIWLAKELAPFGITLKLNAASSAGAFRERLQMRKHQLALITLSSDYLHAHSNANALCANSDREDVNMFDEPHTLAWYCHWHDAKISEVIKKAAQEKDPEVQLSLYKEVQKALTDRGPYAFLLEEAAYVTGSRGLLPQIGAIDNQTRYSLPTHS